MPKELSQDNLGRFKRLLSFINEILNGLLF